MFRFFGAKDRWKWDAAKGVPNKKVLKQQRQALRSSSVDLKLRVLDHVCDLAEGGAAMKAALCDGKVTADICSRFLQDTPSVQAAAAEALAVLCQDHPGNCGALLSNKLVVPHALALVQAYAANSPLAQGAVALLDVLLTAAPDAAAPVVLLQPGSTAALLAALDGCSRASLSAGVSEQRSAALLALLQQLVGLLWTAASCGGTAVCRELGKGGGLGLLLELTRSHRSARSGLGAEGGDGAAGGGEVDPHVAVVRDALGVLALVLAQVPAHRLPLLEADGVSALLSALKDVSLPWSVRQHACNALEYAAASASVAAELVQRCRGLDVVFLLLENYAKGRGLPGPPTAPQQQDPAAAGTSTPSRGAAQAATTATPSRAPRASPGPSTTPAPPAASPLAARRTPAAPPAQSPLAAAGGVEEPEPAASSVVEDLLRLADRVACARDAALAGSLAEAGRVKLLLGVFRAGMSDFRGGSYRVAAACAQVLYHLSRHPAALPLLSGPAVTGPLAQLPDRALDYAEVGGAKSAAVVHGAWCATGLLCQVLKAERASEPKAAATSPVLRTAIKLLHDTAPAVLAAVGAAPPPPTASPAGLALLQSEQVVSDLQSCVWEVLELLGALAGHADTRVALQQADAAAAARRLLPWRYVQWPAKRLLHLLGEMEVEYVPFVRYGCGPLLVALLEGQGVAAGPLVARQVDAHILLSLDEHYLRHTLGLDEVQIIKIRRIRSAHDLFSAMDAADARIDGCVSGPDVEAYLVHSANMRPAVAADLRERIFRELQVLPGEPICFAQFVRCFPWLDAELDAFVPRGLGGMGPGGAAGGGGGGGGGPSRAASGGKMYAQRGAVKRQRVGAGESPVLIDDD